MTNVWKLGIVGSRSFTDKEWLFRMIDGCVEIRKSLDSTVEIVSGGAKNGADKFAKEFCQLNSNKVTYKEFPAEWDKYGKSAGMLRNPLIVSYCDFLFIFWDGESPGTKNTILHCRKHILVNKNKTKTIKSI